MSQNINQPTKSWSMRQLYKQTRHISDDHGIEGYNIIKKYEDPAAIIKSREQSVHKRKVRELKRGSYLDDEIYAKKDIPGVCKYNLLQKQKGKKFKTLDNSNRKTYLDQIMDFNKRYPSPAPGAYNVLQKMGSNTIEGNPSLSRKFDGFSQKLLKAPVNTYLDHAQYKGILSPGVGQYIVNKNVRSKTEQISFGGRKSPQQWRSHHKQAEKRSKQKIKDQVPGSGAYNPKPLQYELFEQKKKLNRFISEHKVSLQKPTRFRTESTIVDKSQKPNLGPGKYNLINQWAHKQKNKKGLLQLISKATPQSVYYH